MRRFLFVFLLFCLSCSPHSNKDSAPRIVIVNHELEEYLNKFVKQLADKGEKEKGIVINLRKSEDTTFVIIVNSMPDIEMTKINGMLVINGYHAYLTGALLETFYKVNPEKVYMVDKIILDSHMTKISDYFNREPLEWNMVFVGDSIINVPIHSFKRSAGQR